MCTSCCPNKLFHRIPCLSYYHLLCSFLSSYAHLYNYNPTTHSIKTLIQFKGATISHVIFTFVGLKTYGFLDTKVLQERADQNVTESQLYFSLPFIIQYTARIQISSVVPVRIFTAMLTFPLEDLIKIHVFHLLDSKLERLPQPSPFLFFFFFWSSMALIYLKSLGQSFCSLLSIWICLAVPSLVESGYFFFHFYMCTT